MSEVDMKTWMRGRAASCSASQARSMSSGTHAGQAADDRALHFLGDAAHRLEVARRGDRESGLDHVHSQPRELPGDVELLLDVQGRARRLLAVAQRRIEDDVPGIHRSSIALP